MLDDAQIADVVFADQFQQRTHARRMHLDANEIFVAKFLRNRRSGLTHAEADLDDQRRIIAKNCCGIELGIDGKRQHEFCSQRIDRAHLGRRHAALAQHETADGAMRCWQFVFHVEIIRCGYWTLGTIRQ